MGKRRSFFTQKNMKYFSKHPAQFCIALIVMGCVYLGAGIYFAVGLPAEIPAVILILAGILSILFGIVVAIAAKNDKKRYLQEQEMLAKSNINDVDNMNGRTFEQFLHALYTKLGYQSTLTRTSGDYGADLILKKDGLIIAVQAKHSKNKISISAVQEIIGAKKYYQATKTAVVTNNYFTKPAQNLAEANNVELIDRTKLASLICQSKNINENLLDEKQAA